jgi:hypothetical protein
MFVPAALAGEPPKTIKLPSGFNAYEIEDASAWAAFKKEHESWWQTRFRTLSSWGTEEQIGEIGLVMAGDDRTLGESKIKAIEIAIPKVPSGQTPYIAVEQEKEWVEENDTYVLEWGTYPRININGFEVKGEKKTFETLAHVKAAMDVFLKLKTPTVHGNPVRGFTLVGLTETEIKALEEALKATDEPTEEDNVVYPVPGTTRPYRCR